MSIETIARCNFCPKVRDPERNHWAVIFADENGHLVKPWNEDDAKEQHAQHACSDECVKASLSVYLTRQRDSRASTEAACE